MLLLVLNLILVHPIESNNINIQQNDVLCGCFKTIVDQYFLTRSNIVVQTNRNKIDCLDAIQMAINSNDLIPEKLVETPDSYIINYDNLKDLNNTLKKLRSSPGFSNQANCLVIANNKTDLQNISTYLWNIRFYKSLMLLPTKRKVELYELNLKDSKCGVNIKPKKINECVNDIYKYDLILFSVDMKTNFHKCPLRIIWTETPPWVFHVNKSNPGIYIELLNMFGEVSKFQIVYMPETDVYREELGYQYSFETMMEDLDRDYADVFVGLVSAAPRSYLKSTSIIYDDNLYFIVPKPKMIPYWITLIKLYSFTNWVIVTILFILIACLFTITAKTTIDRDKLGNFGKNVFVIFAINLNHSVNIIPDSFRLRWFLGSILIYSLIMAAVIQGKFYSFISNPLYESPVTNLEQLVNSDIPIKLSGGFKIIFMFNGPISERVLNRMEILPSMDLLENSIKAYNENFATIIDRGVLITHPNIKDKMQIFDLFSFETCFFMQSKHMLFEYFDRTLQRIIECGFMEKFISHIKFEYSLLQYTKEENKVFRITVTHLEGAFFALLLGYILSFAFFICEYVYFYWRKK